MVAGIGISILGTLYNKQLIHPSTTASMKSLTNINLYDIISQEFGYPVYLENDADAAALTENLLTQMDPDAFAGKKDALLLWLLILLCVNSI